MIAQIRGRLIHKEPGSVVVEANGLGYRVFVSLTTFYELPDLEQAVTLHTYTHVREDALQLFGFSTPLEKEMFQILIGVTGIGPKLALNILSGITPEELLHSLDQRDMNRLQSVPGIGRKMAERMVVDLQEKARKIGSRDRPGAFRGKAHGRIGGGRDLRPVKPGIQKGAGGKGRGDGIPPGSESGPGKGPEREPEDSGRGIES